MPKNNLLKLIHCLILCSFISAGCQGKLQQPESTPTRERIPSQLPSLQTEIEKLFQGYPGSFVLFDQENDRYLRFSPERAAGRLLPASTFKILHALIALETGVVPDENYVIPWDGTHYAVPAWNQNHTLKSAIQDSVVWYFQEVARRIGRERMQRNIDAVGYGNGDISGKVDSFWLEGGLRISADEQVEFLRRFYQNDLPFSTRSLDIVKGSLVLEDTPDSRESGKTGATQLNGMNVGWFVGYVEKGANVYYFATNLNGTNPEIDGVKAREVTENILRYLGLLGGG